MLDVFRAFQEAYQIDFVALGKEKHLVVRPDLIAFVGGIRDAVGDEQQAGRGHRQGRKRFRKGPASLEVQSGCRDQISSSKASLGLEGLKVGSSLRVLKMNWNGKGCGSK